jgi:hypothetical protein
MASGPTDVKGEPAMQCKRNRSRQAYLGTVARSCSHSMLLDHMKPASLGAGKTALLSLSAAGDGPRVRIGGHCAHGGAASNNIWRVLCKRATQALRTIGEPKPYQSQRRHARAEHHREHRASSPQAQAGGQGRAKRLPIARASISKASNIGALK